MTDLIENAKSEIKPARKIPHSIRNAVKKELNSMVVLEVIKRVKESTPVVSPVVIIRKTKKIKICIRTDVNRNIIRLKMIDEIATRANSRYFTLVDCRRGFWKIKVNKRTEKVLNIFNSLG